MQDKEETEVFRILESEFEENKDTHHYAYALYTRKEGSWSKCNLKYFTTNKLQYVGKYLYSVISGFGDGSSMYSVFNCNGKEIRVDYDYEGRTSFRVVNPLEYEK